MYKLRVQECGEKPCLQGMEINYDIYSRTRLKLCLDGFSPINSIYNVIKSLLYDETINTAVLY